MNRTPLKPGKPLTRKTPLKSGRKPMAKVSKKNSHPFQDKALQNVYRQAHKYCELTKWFMFNQPQWPIQYFDSLDLHHIRGRHRDVWPNFIRVCRSIHEFDAKHPKEMFVVCLWHKWRKGGIDWNVKELDKCGNGSTAGELQRCKPELEAFLPLWHELMATLGDNPKGI